MLAEAISDSIAASRRSSVAVGHGQDGGAGAGTTPTSGGGNDTANERLESSSLDASQALGSSMGGRQIGNSASNDDAQSSVPRRVSLFVNGTHEDAARADSGGGNGSTGQGKNSSGSNEVDIDGSLLNTPSHPRARTSSIDRHEQHYIELMERRKSQMRQQLLDKKKVPNSYYSLSPKEQLILQYVDNFNRQYCQLYPGRKELILAPLNEFGIKKFICTTIRPTQLPYKELYDYRSCASFVADFIAYEPLDPPHELPKSVPSPTYTLKIQSGNCFDMSVLLTSMLRGVGYDAYVVSGYATRMVTMMDQTKTSSDEFVVRTAGMGIDDVVKMSNSRNSNDSAVISGSGGANTTVGSSAAHALTASAVAAMVSASGQNQSALAPILPPNKYKVKPPRQLKSNFLTKQDERRKQLLLKKEGGLDKQQGSDAATAVAAAAQDEDDEDELQGLRVHAWVLVLPGKREVAEAFFIESSTGRIVSIEDENYLGLESVFSSQNYWVNMQVCYDGLRGISFDIGDNAKWEFVFLNNTQPGGINRIGGGISGGGADGGGGGVGDDDDDAENSTDIVDLTPSWVERLQLTHEQFESRCPLGTKLSVYKNAKWEKFAEYHRADGMVSRITYFALPSWATQKQEQTTQPQSITTSVATTPASPTSTQPIEIHEIFENRRDKLCERIRSIRENHVQELFGAGRIPHGLKKHILVDGKTTEMHFYPSARSDGLVRRLESPHKVVEHFTEREDRLVYRSVTYEIENASNIPLPNDAASLRARGAMTKMTEKFMRNPDTPLHEDIQKKTYFAKDERIRIVFHLGAGRVISSYREFRKPSADQKGNFLDLTNAFEVDPYMKPPKRQHLYAQLLDLLRTEQACTQAIKNSERELSDILQLRQSEERDVALTISVYDTLRNDTKLPTDDDGKEVHKGDEEENKAVDIDYLSPFLLNFETSHSLSREEAVMVRDSCLKSLKERLIEKANIIQNRLDEATAEYQRRQLAYSRNADSMTAEETDDYVRFCNDALFRIHILEKRLAKHKEAAPERYMELDTKLRADQRLALAYSG